MRPKNRIAALIACLLLAALSVGDKRESPTVTKVSSKAIPFKVTYQFDRSLGPGRLIKARDGVPGSINRTIEYIHQDGKLIPTGPAAETRVAPVDAVIAMGRHGYESTRGSYVRTKVLAMSATGYSHEENTNWTRLGLRALYGVVAVDPRTIALGSRVYVEGYGFAIAGDTGGAIKGNRIDLCFDTRAQALRFGRKSVVVHVLG